MLRRRLYITLFRTRFVTLFLFFKIFISKVIVFFIMSFEQQSCLCIAFEIERYNILVNIACKRCSLFNCFCIIIKDVLFCLKCLKCVCTNKLCVNMSWFSFNYNRKDLFVKIAKDKVLLAIVIIWLLRNKKILKKIDAKAKRKT